MIDILKATKARFEGDATLTALGTMYGWQVPPNTNLPYAKQSIVGSSNEHAFGNPTIENTQVQFSIYANTLTEIRTYYNAVIARFPQNVSLSLDDGTFMGCQRLSQWCDLEPQGTDKVGKPVFMAWVRYRLKADRAA
jgi:hypothetical protein